MQIELPEKVQTILTTIEQAGYEAYIVGGCVRDSILGRIPDDWDITTSATPLQIKELFHRTVDTGIQHGTVTVMMDKEGFEVTTYRIDGEYEDCRHPKEVTYTGSLEEDLKRRDFTINAMAYNPTKGLVDLFGGMKDIEKKSVCCVGNAEERFSEDALRILRAIRFSAQLGYSIEEKTVEAIRKLAPSLKKISAERIQTELVKTVVSRHPEYLRAAYEYGVTKEILPEFDRAMNMEQKNPHHCYTVGEHTLKTMQNIEADKVLRLTMLFHDLGKVNAMKEDSDGVRHFHGHALISEKIARTVLTRLKFDNDTIRKVTVLIRYHDHGNGEIPSEYMVRKSISMIGENLFPKFLKVKQADMDAQSSYQRKEKEESLNAFKTAYQNILKRGDCVSLKTLAVTGKDLIDAGMKPGKKIGKILNGMLDFVMEHPECNEKTYLMRKFL